VKFVIALLIVLAPVAAHGQLLKCVGTDGKVEYASQCPPDTKEIQTGIRNVPLASPPAATQKSLAEREADFRKRQTEGTEARQKNDAKAAEKSEQREACERARTNLKGLQEGQRIVQVDPKTGERVFLEDANRPAEIARAQKAADSNCK
jgi:alpha-ketoglutarate-dependent taurine dioxygenase